MTSVNANTLYNIHNAVANSIRVKGASSRGDLVISNSAGVCGLRKKVIDLTTTYTVLAADSGSLYTLGTAGGFTVTLPAVAACAGCEFDFVVKVAPTTAYTIHSAASDVHGMGLSSDLDGAGNVDSTQGTAVDDLAFVANEAKIGDRLHIFSDGTFFYAAFLTSGVLTAVTFT